MRKYNQIPKKGPMAEQALNEYLELKSSEEKNVINTDKVCAFYIISCIQLDDCDTSNWCLHVMAHSVNNLRFLE